MQVGDIRYNYDPVSNHTGSIKDGPGIFALKAYKLSVKGDKFYGTLVEGSLPILFGSKFVSVNWGFATREAAVSAYIKNIKDEITKREEQLTKLHAILDSLGESP
jgi:hypothetical protein